MRHERYDNKLKMLCCKHQPLYPSNSSAIREDDDDYDDEDLILCCEQDNGMYL